MKEFIQRCHNIAKEKGFWDRPRNHGEAAALAFGELSECLDAHQNGRFSDYESYKSSGDYKANIKNTFEEEPADAYIRICDMIGGFFRDDVYDGKFPIELVDDQDVVGDWICALSFIITSARMTYAQGYVNMSLKYYFDALHGIELFCDQFGIDLRWHIEEKLKFNETRERLHGKKY